MTATDLQLVGRVATATVQLDLTYALNENKTDTRSVALPVRFIQQDGGWRWDGPALVWQQPAGGFAAAHPSELKEAVTEFSRSAVEHYARIAAQLGLPPTSQFPVQNSAEAGSAEAAPMRRMFGRRSPTC